MLLGSNHILHNKPRKVQEYAEISYSYSLFMQRMCYNVDLYNSVCHRNKEYTVIVDANSRYMIAFRYMKSEVLQVN